jgi:chemotaxis family two-component system response regulator Rcp1
LLVEDNETDAFVIREILKESSIRFQLHLAVNGERALALLGISPGTNPIMNPGLILLDLNIPRIHGLEVLAQVRADARYRDTPVVVVTSSESQKDRDAVQALRGNAYFCKPSDLDGFLVLEQVIRGVLRLGENPAEG